MFSFYFYNMNVRCPHCQEIFEADQQQAKLLTYAIGKGQRLVMLDCPECYWNVPVNPGDLLSHEPQKDEPSEHTNAKPVKCPQCAEGVMCYVNDGNEEFWGCGECGHAY